MAIKDKLISNKPREIAGSRTRNRYNFQINWSLYQLLDMHESQNDYLFIFDYHEDLLIMESESNPQQINFYQIKGKRGKQWTLGELIKANKDKEGNPLLSIIGKLYACKSKFPGTASLNFVSNACFNIKMEEKSSPSLSKDKICIIELNSKDKDRIASTLKKEFSLENDPIYEDITFLNVTSLSLEQSDTHTRGRLTEFLDRKYPENQGKLPISVIYNHLFKEVDRRTSVYNPINTFDDLIKEKGIGKTLFDSWLETMFLSKDFDKIWEDINAELRTETWSFGERRRLKATFDSYEIDSKNPNNEIIKLIRKKVSKVLLEVDMECKASDASLSEYLNSVLSKYNESPLEQNLYNEEYIKTIILVECYVG